MPNTILHKNPFCNFENKMCPEEVVQTTPKDLKTHRKNLK
jgi:hypothetical protein